MAIAGTNIVSNDRGITFQVTGDGTTTAYTATFNQKLDSGLATSSAQVITAPTGFFTPSGAAGLIYPTGGTPVTVSSSSVSTSTGVVTINTSAAVGNGTVGYCVAVFNHEAN